MRRSTAERRAVRYLQRRRLQRTNYDDYGGYERDVMDFSFMAWRRASQAGGDIAAASDGDYEDE
eukprot:4563829-Pyramimonas_sp.AAC.1